MSEQFIKYVKILGKGKKGSRSLTADEAEQAMGLILLGKVTPEQVGAFWMLIRIREETVDETVGFTKAIRTHCQIALNADVHIDWPAYAGKRNELPWFLLAALTLSQQGVRIFMHGHCFENEERLYVEDALVALGLPIAKSVKEAEKHLNEYNFAYMALEQLSGPLAQLMNLKLLLGLRSPVNTLVRMMNLARAKHSVHGVFHKGYDELHIKASAKLGDRSVLVFRGGNGEAEINPERDVDLGVVQNGNIHWEHWPRATFKHCRQTKLLNFDRMRWHWSDSQFDEFGELATLSTMASVLSLLTKKSQKECLQIAKNYWGARDKQMFQCKKIA